MHCIRESARPEIILATAAGFRLALSRLGIGRTPFKKGDDYEQNRM